MDVKNLHHSLLTSDVAWKKEDLPSWVLEDLAIKRRMSRNHDCDEDFLKKRQRENNTQELVQYPIAALGKQEITKRPLEKLAWSRGMLFGGIRLIPRDPSVDPPMHSCFNCWERGHRRRDCPKATGAVYCFNCGRRGLKAIECQRCSEAYRIYDAKRRSLSDSKRYSKNLSKNDFEEKSNKKIERRKKSSTKEILDINKNKIVDLTLIKECLKKESSGNTGKSSDSLTENGLSGSKEITKQLELLSSLDPEAQIILAKNIAEKIHNGEIRC